MSATTIGPTAVPVPSVPPIPVREMLPFAIFFGIVAAVVLYFVGMEQGLFSVFAGSDIHEWVHDGRHLLGFPCH